MVLTSGNREEIVNGVKTTEGKLFEEEITENKGRENICAEDTMDRYFHSVDIFK